MVTGATSLSMVRNELFTTMVDTQNFLEKFLEERDNGTLLQQVVTNFQQIKGILSLIELTGAELLAQEMQTLAMDIPAGADQGRNEQLTAINNALHVLHRYLEQLEANWVEMPELLLPAINSLRLANQQPRLPESYFFSVRLNLEHPDPGPRPEVPNWLSIARRLRQMYQTGLLSLLRDENLGASYGLMGRAMERLDGINRNPQTNILFWLAAATFEAMQEGKLLLNSNRKMLFSRIDREIRQSLQAPERVIPRGLIKDLLYLITLAGTNGRLVSQVRAAVSLPSMPFTDHMLADEYQRLTGPSVNVLHSLSAAIMEELTQIKDTLDLVGRGSDVCEQYEALQVNLGKLEKILGMVGLNTASNNQKKHLSRVIAWQGTVDVPAQELQELADTILYVEGSVQAMEKGNSALAEEETEAQAFARHQLAEARFVVLYESKSGLSLAKSAISSYCESSGDSAHLQNIPLTLTNVRGGLHFIGEERAARLIDACAQYIQHHMINAMDMPVPQALESLADALASLEYYLEGGAALNKGGDRQVLDLAEESIQALGVQVVQ